MRGCVGVADTRVVEPIDPASALPRHQVAVDPQGEGCRVVPQLVLDVGQVFPGLDQQAGEGVAQGVGLPVAQLGRGVP